MIPDGPPGSLAQTFSPGQKEGEFAISAFYQCMMLESRLRNRQVTVWNVATY